MKCTNCNKEIPKNEIVFLSPSVDYSERVRCKDYTKKMYRKLLDL
jgi:hypothetical protein